MRLKSRTLGASLVLGASLLAAGMPAWAVKDSPGGPAVKQLNLQTPVTQIAEQIYSIHNLMLYICLAIFVAVFGVMFYSILKHRKSLGHKPATFHESTTVEILWTIVPFFIVIGMALPATKTVVAMKDTSNADVTIKATGMQWKWGYDYLKGEGEGISFLSTLSTPRTQVGAPGLAPTEARGVNYLLEVDNEVVVPVNKKIRIITTANDVIHGWTIPAFGVKQDAIPGFVRDTWFKAEKIGTYRGQCVELCGKEHAFMPIVVKVVSDADYTAWVDTKKKEMAAKAKDKKLQPKDWEGNTFSISNLGMFGIDEFTAIINPPDSCIMAVGGIKKVAAFKEDGSIYPTNIMKVTLSCDHRVVDGATGSAFLQTFKKLLENPLGMLV